MKSRRNPVSVACSLLVQPNPASHPSHISDPYPKIHTTRIPLPRPRQNPSDPRPEMSHTYRCQGPKRHRKICGTSQLRQKLQACDVGVLSSGGGIWDPQPSAYEPDEVPLRTVEPRSFVILSMATLMDACQRVVRSVGLCQAVCHQFVIRSCAKQALLDAPITLLPARIRRAPLVTGQLWADRPK